MRSDRRSRSLSRAGVALEIDFAGPADSSAPQYVGKMLAITSVVIRDRIVV